VKEFSVSDVQQAGAKRSNAALTVAVIIPVYNAAHLIAETVCAVRSGLRQPDDLIVVDDGSSDESARVAASAGARVIVMAHNVGPAACRNEAACHVTRDVLVFLDADTIVHADTIDRMMAHLERDPSLSGVIGAYDDTPRDAGACSQFRNLAHCFVHRTARPNALTFWSGCGALRRSALLRVRGFDERFRRPSVEDLELGYRITDAGGTILLDPEITVTHVKRWTLWNGLRTDVWDRGVPWMGLVLDRRSMPNDLNLKVSDRWSTVAAGAAVLCAPVGGWWMFAALALAAVSLGLHRKLLTFIYRRKGGAFLFAAAGYILIQQITNILAAVWGLLSWAVQPRRREVESRVGKQLDCSGSRSSQEGAATAI
jgi:hypothetical protein